MEKLGFSLKNEEYLKISLTGKKVTPAGIEPMTFRMKEAQNWPRKAKKRYKYRYFSVFGHNSPDSPDYPFSPDSPFSPEMSHDLLI